MKIRHFLATAILSLSAWALSTGFAQASTVMYEGLGFMQGTQTFTNSMNLESSGTLTVTLSNMAWPQPLASLNLVLSSSSGMLGHEMTGDDTEIFNVESGNVLAQWFGTAQGPLNAGVYGIKIEFQPSATAVPLPTSIALLLSGLCLLAWQRRSPRLALQTG
jgi:hypothetical protein